MGNVREDRKTGSGNEPGVEIFVDCRNDGIDRRAPSLDTIEDRCFPHATVRQEGTDHALRVVEFSAVAR
jgi:hypothetical protein